MVFFALCSILFPTKSDFVTCLFINGMQLKNKMQKPELSHYHQEAMQQADAVELSVEKLDNIIDGTQN